MSAEGIVNAFVVYDDDLLYDLLIGRDFLDQEHILIIKRGKARVGTNTTRQLLRRLIRATHR